MKTQDISAITTEERIWNEDRKGLFISKVPGNHKDSAISLFWRFDKEGIYHIRIVGTQYVLLAGL